MKDVQRQGDCPVPKFCAQGGGGSSNADVRTFWCKKLRLKFKVYSHGRG